MVRAVLSNVCGILLLVSVIQAARFDYYATEPVSNSRIKTSWGTTLEVDLSLPLTMNNRTNVDVKWTMPDNTTLELGQRNSYVSAYYTHNYGEYGRIHMYGYPMRVQRFALLPAGRVTWSARITSPDNVVYHLSEIFIISDDKQVTSEQ